MFLVQALDSDPKTGKSLFSPIMTHMPRSNCQVCLMGPFLKPNRALQKLSGDIFKVFEQEPPRDD